MKLRLLFAGSPAIALPSLKILGEGHLAGTWELAGILTNPDKPRGRSGRAESSDVGACGETLSEICIQRGLPPIPLLKPETLKAEAREAAAALQPDLLVCFAYGRIFGPKFRSIFPLGGINIHPSLLPKYRGASPIQEALLHRDDRTGVSIQRIAEEMDTGNILAQRELPLTGRETTESLSILAAETGAQLLTELLEGLGKIASGATADKTVTDRDVRAALETALEGKPQQGEASYCSLIERDSALIDWTQSAPELDAKIRAYNPWPLARTGHGGRILYILEALALPAEFGPFQAPGEDEPGRVLGIDKKSGILVRTGRGILALTKLQYQSKKALPWQVFINGARDFAGSCLSGGS